jgi:hypothetical protein
MRTDAMSGLRPRYRSEWVDCMNPDEVLWQFLNQLAEDDL